MDHTGVKLRWVNGDSQLANSLTKEDELHQMFEFFRREGRWEIVYDPELLSGRRRRQLGLKSLDVKTRANPSESFGGGGCASEIA